MLSHDRELTIAVAHSLMSRIWPEPRALDVPALPGPAAVQLPRQAGPVTSRPTCWTSSPTTCSGER